MNSEAEVVVVASEKVGGTSNWAKEVMQVGCCYELSC